MLKKMLVVVAIQIKYFVVIDCVGVEVVVDTVLVGQVEGQLGFAVVEQIVEVRDTSSSYCC